MGGLGTAVAEAVAMLGVPARIGKLGIDDEYVLVAPPSHLYRHYGLTTDGVVERLRALLEQ